MSKNECAVPKEIVNDVPKITVDREPKPARTIFTFDG
jgi:hypothetical protein